MADPNFDFGTITQFTVDIHTSDGSQWTITPHLNHSRRPAPSLVTIAVNGEDDERLGRVDPQHIIAAIAGHTSTTLTLRSPYGATVEQTPVPGSMHLGNKVHQITNDVADLQALADVLATQQRLSAPPASVNLVDDGTIAEIARRAHHLARLAERAHNR
jgi:hypothetical protein